MPITVIRISGHYAVERRRRQGEERIYWKFRYAFDGVGPRWPWYFEPSAPEPEPIQPPQPIEADGYSKSGPGPTAALRFRWTVRQDGAQYYVDETVGEGTAPLVNGPMGRDAAIKFVDDREAEARRRFEHFKHEIASRTAAALRMSRDSNEA